MHCGDMRKKISEMQLFPVAFNSSLNSTSWVSLKNETQASASGYNIDYLVIQKPKSRTSFNNIIAYLISHPFPWHVLMFISIFLNYVVISYVYFFVQPKTEIIWPFYLIVACDVLYMLDVVFGVIVFVNNNLSHHATETRNVLLGLDALLSLPYSYVCLAAIRNTQSMIFLCFRFIAFLRIYRLQLLFKEIEKSVCMHRKLIFSIKFMCYLFLVQHGITCLWYLLARPIGHRNDVNWSNVLQNVSYHPKNVVDWYFVSSYAALSQLTRCGFGDILSTNSFERIASVVAMSFGILFTSMYISSLILLFVNANHPKHTIQKQVLLILTRLKLTENNTDVTDAILRYFEKFWTRKLGILYTKELNLLPDEISLQVHNDVNCTLLKCSVIFRTKPDEFLRKVSVLLRHEFYAPGENIYVENQIKYKLVIVKSGSVDILSEEDRVTPIITFGPRTCLGEASLILCLPANVTLRAATYVELQALYMKDFFTISTNYPEYFNEIRTVIFKRMYKMASHDRKDTNALKHLKHALAIKSSELLDPEHCATNLLSLYRYQDNVRRKRADSWLERARFPCILNRNTNVMLTWEFFIAACALFVAVLYPYYVTFEHRFPLWLEAVTDLIHVIFVLDIYVLLTTSVVKKGRVLNSFKSLLDERMDTVGFHLDVFASFYVEVFGYLAEDVDRVYYLLKLNRLLKVYRLSTLCERLQNKLIANSVCIAFAKYVTYLLLMVYWFSVLLYFQTCYYDSCVHNGWFIKEIADDVQSRILTATDKGKFFLALYFGSSTILGVCIGDVLPANLQDLSFVMGGLLVGTLVLGYCIAEMACHLRLELQSYFDFSEKMSLLEFHMQNRYVPDKLETRIVRYFDTQWECNEAYAFLSKTALLHNVPTYLQGDILKQERLDVLQKIGFFSNIDNSFMNYLVLHSSLVVLPPNEIVTYFGSISREMYVIYKGYCLQQTENNEYITVGPDKAIGYPSLLFGLPSLHNVFTITHCILVHINVNTFNEALMSAPGLHRIVYKARQSILAKYQGNFEVKIIENPQFVRKNKNKLKKLIEKNKTKSFVNAYKYCLVTGESYSHLSNRASRVCFPKYLLMPICILPYGPFLKLWVTVRLMITLVVGFCSPIMFVLAPYRQELHFALFLIDLFVYVDMYLMLHVGYYGPRDQLIFHPWKTAEHYLKGSFIVDLLIWFPLAPCMQVINSDHNEGHSAFAHGFSPHMFHCSVLLIRVFDVYRLPYAFKYLKGTLREHTFLVGLKYILYAMLCVHWWSIFLISKTCNFLHETDIRAANNSTPGMIPVPASDLNLYCKENSWVAASVHRNYSDFMDVYTTALYWTTSTMVGMGLGDIFAQNEGETLMSLLILLSGSLYFGYVLANIISRAIVTRDGLFSYEEKLLRLINYMRQEKLDKEFENKVREYLNYKWKRTRGFGVCISLLILIILYVQKKVIVESGYQNYKC